jgi:hypothetical protein
VTLLAATTLAATTLATTTLATTLAFTPLLAQDDEPGKRLTESAAVFPGPG